MIVFKLRKAVYNEFFWAAVFGAFVLFNAIWALTH
jgi:hypothetical protein